MPRPARLTLPIALLAALGGGLAGCTQFPALDAASSDEAMRAPWPHLQPLPPVLAAGEAGTVTETTTSEIGARGDALRRRAAALRAATAN